MTENEKLIIKYLDESILPDELSKLNDILKTDEDARELIMSMSEQSVIVADIERTRSLNEKPSKVQINESKNSWIMPALAALVAIALTINFLYSNNKESETLLANSISGQVTFTDKNGNLLNTIGSGEHLTDGTISSDSEDASVELIFKDQSKVSFFGKFSAKIMMKDQSLIQLKHGYLSANISPQPNNQSFTIETTTAKIEVIGTKFEVDASKRNTKLTVSEGVVLFTRLKDGKTLKVTAEETAETQGEEQDFTVLFRDSKPIHNWKSNFESMPNDWFYGEILPATDKLPIRLKAKEKTFFNQEQGKDITIYRVGQRTQWHTATPVTLKKNSKIRVKGKINHPTQVYMLLLSKYPTGGYAGNFMRNAQPKVDDQGNFEIVATTDEFERQKPWPLRNIAGLQVYSITVYTVDANEGLEVSEMEILTPEEQ